MPRRPLLLDACVAINLAATDRLPDLADKLDVTFVMIRQAAAEVGHLRDTIDGELVSTPIDLAQHTAGPTLQLIDLTPSEYPLYLALARIVDDGKAAMIAAAASRNIQLATDDRKSRRLCADHRLREPSRTLALIQAYADGAKLDAAQVRDLLIRILDRASFQPRRADPDYKWWSHHIHDL